MLAKAISNQQNEIFFLNKEKTPTLTRFVNFGKKKHTVSLRRSVEKGWLLSSRETESM